MDVTLGGSNLSTFGITVTHVSHGIAPRTFEKTLHIAGRDGLYDFGADIRERIHEIGCAFTSASTQTALQTLVRAFADHLVDVDGKPRDLDLVYGDESGKTYTARLYGELPVRRMVELGEFTLRLLSADPFAHSSTNTTADSITAAEQAVTVTNSGTVSTPVKITITNNGAGNVTGFTLTRRQEHT